MSQTRCSKIVSECIGIAEADENKYKKQFHGAVVAYGNKIIGTGFNDIRRCFVRGEKYFSIHAEMMALMMSGLTPLSKKGKYSHKRGLHGGIRKRNYDLWVVRVGATSNLKYSYPCNECINMMKNYGIHRVFYSDHDGNMICRKVSEIEMIRETCTWTGQKLTDIF